MNDDLTLLASAYLDGDVTADERARVEADASLLAEVERLRNVRAALLDATRFEHPAEDVRERAILAALSTWDDATSERSDRVAGSRRAVRRSPILSFERRRAYTRWLGAAAALVAVGALGVVIAQSGGNDDEADQSVAFEATDETARAEASAELTEQIEPPAATDRALLSGDVAAEDLAGTNPDSAGSAEAPSAEIDAPAPADTTPAASVVSGPQANLTTPEELGAFAADVDRNSGVNRDVTVPCGGEAFDDIRYVATATYRGEPVVIGIDDERAIAVDPATCEIVAQAPLP